ncbi:uncharacterized protein [Miscanthus floridulus]|uniref:uncharacterized protein n=1 Tax=Miscanthus floridulus TaxID=154761 RepID=UPI0034592083
MAAVVQHQHHVKALTPTWFLANVTPPPAPREGGKKALPAAYSPLLLSPAGWQRAQDEKKKKKDESVRDGGLPASPRITCMGQVKGRRRSRGCSSARGPALPPRDSRYRGAGAGGKVANLVLGLFGMRRNARTSRACAKVRDVPRAGTASAPGSTRGVHRVVAVAAVGVFDPPLPVVRRPATDDNAPSLWERRRGGRALEGLQLMT